MEEIESGTINVFCQLHMRNVCFGDFFCYVTKQHSMNFVVWCLMNVLRNFLVTKGLAKQ